MYEQKSLWGYKREKDQTMTPWMKNSFTEEVILDLGFIWTLT